ncbi:MAG: DUF559 domain-containing protein [bacterium]
MAEKTKEQFLDDYIDEIRDYWKDAKADVKKLMKDRKVKQALGLVVSQIPQEQLKKATRQELKTLMSSIRDDIEEIGGNYKSYATALGWTAEELAGAVERINWQTQFVDDVTKSTYDRLSALFDAKYGTVQELEKDLRLLFGEGKADAIAKYKEEIKGIVDDLIAGKTTTAGWEETMQGLIQRGYEDVFKTGRLDYGIIEELTDRERARLEKIVKEEYEFLSNFRKDIEKGELIEVSPDAIRARANLYGDAFGSVYEEGKISTLKDDVEIWWQLGVPETMHCFPKGTMILTNQGEIEIEKIKAGDMVFTLDGFQKVLKVFKRSFRGIFKVIEQDKPKVFCTPNHQFLVKWGSKAKWIKAQNLIDRTYNNSDELLIFNKDNKIFTFCKVKVYDDNQYETNTEVYNLAVEKAHHYIANGFVVHNCDVCPEIAEKSPYTRDTLPFMPGDGSTPCFFNAGKVKVLTQEKGYMPLPKVKEGMNVLSHTGKFRKVLNHTKFNVENCNAVILTYEVGNEIRKVTVTPDHLFLSDLSWVRADQLKVGDKLVRMGKKCKREECSTIFNFRKNRDVNKIYCSSVCLCKAEGKTRTINAHKKNRELYLQGKGALQRWRANLSTEEAFKAASNAGKIAHQKHPRRGKTYEELYGEERAKRTKEKIGELRKGRTLIDILGKEKAQEIIEISRKNMLGGQAKRMRILADESLRKCNKGTFEERFGEEKAAQIKEKISDTVKQLWKQNPNKFLIALKEGNLKRRTGENFDRTKRTDIEVTMAQLLTELGIRYKEQIWFLGKYCVDFLLPDYNLIIEVDGEYWHTNKKEFDANRDNELKSLRGLDTVRFSRQRLKKNKKEIKEELIRLIANHNEAYRTKDDIIIKEIGRKIKSGVVECLQVEEDESFIINKGLISHNCLSNCACSLLFVYPDGTEKGEVM